MKLYHILNICSSLVMYYNVYVHVALRTHA